MFVFWISRNLTFSLTGNLENLSDNHILFPLDWLTTHGKFYISANSSFADLENDIIFLRCYFDENMQMTREQVIHVLLIWKMISNCSNQMKSALRVFRVVTWLTVYRPFRILITWSAYNLFSWSFNLKLFAQYNFPSNNCVIGTRCAIQSDENMDTSRHFTEAIFFSSHKMTRRASCSESN